MRRKVRNLISPSIVRQLPRVPDGSGLTALRLVISRTESTQPLVTKISQSKISVRKLGPCGAVTYGQVEDYTVAAGRKIELSERESTDPQVSGPYVVWQSKYGPTPDRWNVHICDASKASDQAGSCYYDSSVILVDDKTDGSLMKYPALVTDSYLVYQKNNLSIVLEDRI